MLKRLNKSFSFDLSATALREVTDVLVILSLSILSYYGVCEWSNSAFLEKTLGVAVEKPSILYFLGVALVMFSLRRMSDQRRERRRRIAAERHAKIATNEDPLTRFPNRKHFESLVAEVLKRSHKPIIVVLGLDRFKNLSVLFGHLGCDQVLAQIANRLRDGVPAGNVIARIGDDEFAVSFNDSSPESVGDIAAALIKSVRQPVQVGIEYQSISANVGIALAGHGPVTVDELLRCASVALSRAKSTNVEYCFFDPKMDAQVRERVSLEKDLRDALGSDRIRPYYQPIVDLKTRRIISFESLARWEHPVRGFISPETFVPLAEELGVIDYLSGQLFGDACRDAVKWPDYISLSFNFSPSQLSDRSLSGAILTVLHETGLPPYRLEVEITESALVTDLDSTRHVLQKLRSAGVRIVIDDFGTGYSSFQHLYELHFDKLKIDKRFVRDLGASAENDLLARAMIALANGLELCVTAEGVETEQQAEIVSRLGAHQGQGYLFGKAMSAQEVMAFLHDAPARLVA